MADHDPKNPKAPKNHPNPPHDENQSLVDATPVTRREFVASSVGVAAAFGAFGIAGALTEEHLKPSRDLRRPASELPQWAKNWKLVSPAAELDSINKEGMLDVCVIGSGYGGAVTGSRLAQAGKKVCILERGKEWLPGQFPEKINSLLFANRLVTGGGLLDLYMPDKSDVDIISASGIGGTSLINAAISTRPENMVFEQDEWPYEIQDDLYSGKLHAYYDKAANVLKPNKYTGKDPTKVALHRADCKAVEGGEFSYLPLNVAYSDTERKYGNRTVTQPGCVLCGNCTSGCNFGSKNTLQTNYLPMAKEAGARIFSEVEVEYIERLGNSGYRVYYRRYATEETPFDRAKRGIFGSLSELMTSSTISRGHVDAKVVVVSAGSLGSTEIMMKSKAKGLLVTDALGTRVSANGDVMGMSYNGDEPTNMIAGPNKAGVGNALMSYIDYRTSHYGNDIQDRFLLIEGTMPSAMASDVADALAFATVLTRAKEQSNDKLKRSPMEALNHSMLLLACGHDDSGGKFEYVEGGRPRIKWPGVTKQPFYNRINGVMREHAKKLGGIYIENPRTSDKIMATHPLGGCPMGKDEYEGVVNHQGNVWKPDGSLHKGLYIADGSIIPRSLAATPLLTISALSERIADAILANEFS